MKRLSRSFYQNQNRETTIETNIITKSCARKLLLHISLDPGQEMSDFGEYSRLTATFPRSPRNNPDDIILTRFGFGRADQRTARIAHTGRVTVRAKSDHAGPNASRPTGLQRRVRQNSALKLLKRIGHSSWRVDQAPTWKGSTGK